MNTYETQLEFSDDKGHAIIVDFDLNHRLIFWSKALYIPCWDLGKGVWFTPEWLETNSPEDFHCYEPMMDKQLKYSKVKIIESNKTRSKIQWDYACNDIRYRIFHGNTTAQEVYTVFPDGIGVRKLTAFPGDQNSYGGNPNMWQVLEWIIVNGKGTTPEETIQAKDAFVLSNENGETVTLDYPIQYDEFRPLCEIYPQIADWNMYIGRVNLIDRPSPFVIIAKDQRLFPYRPCSHCGKDHPFFNTFCGDNLWTYWPADDCENFILAATQEGVKGKKATATSFIDGNYDFRPALTDQNPADSARKAASYFVDTPPRGTSWLFLTGATEGTQEDLIDLAKSWYYPAAVKTGYECKDSIPGMSQGKLLYEGFAFSERAYTFRKFEEDDIEFTMEPTEKIINPVFLINGWKSQNASVKIDNKLVESDDISYSIAGDDLVLMVTGSFTNKIDVKIFA